MTVSLTTEVDAERVDKASPERSDSSKGRTQGNVIVGTNGKIQWFVPQDDQFQFRPIYNQRMNLTCTFTFTAAVMLAFCCLTACDKSTSPATSPNAAASSSPAASSTSKAADPALEKLQQASGSGATDCGRLGISATPEQLKGASDCALQANKGKHPFYVAYDMPGMTVGVAGNSDAKLFTVQAQGTGSAVTSGDCPSQLRVASSGRLTCFAPGDMSSMSGSHTAGPMKPGMPNPHAGGGAPLSHKP